MLVTVRDAINEQRIDKMEPLMAEHFSIVLADGQLITDLKDLKAYYQRLLDPATGVLKSLTIKPSADDLTMFVDPNVGVCHGISDDTFVLKGGATRVLHSRWTATVARTGDTWKIVALHAGTSILDNPILDEYKQATKAVGIGTGAAAIVLAALGFVAGRRAARR
jgi:ketosteroid isomerase-like protein